VTIIKDCAPGITLPKLTTDRHKTSLSLGLSATAELYLLINLLIDIWNLVVASLGHQYVNSILSSTTHCKNEA